MYMQRTLAHLGAAAHLCSGLILNFSTLVCPGLTSHVRCYTLTDLQ